MNPTTLKLARDGLLGVFVWVATTAAVAAQPLKTKAEAGGLELELQHAAPVPQPKFLARTQTRIENSSLVSWGGWEGFSPEPTGHYAVIRIEEEISGPVVAAGSYAAQARYLTEAQVESSFAYWIIEENYYGELNTWNLLNWGNTRKTYRQRAIDAHGTVADGKLEWTETVTFTQPGLPPSVATYHWVVSLSEPIFPVVQPIITPPGQFEAVPFEQVEIPTATFTSESNGSSYSERTEYKIRVPAGMTGSVYWVEVFTPLDDPATPGNESIHQQTKPHEWPIEGSRESPPYPLDFGNRHGKLEVMFPKPTLAVDADRNGTIELPAINADDATSAENPYRFWVNDDDDSGDMGGDDIPGKTAGANYADGIVNGTRDLIDFFPIFLDLKQLLTVLPPTTPSLTYKLKQADNALNFVYTNLTRDTARDFHTKLFTDTKGFSDMFDQLPGVAITHQITAAGYELPSAFLTGIKDNDWGVLLIEGRKATTAPLVLSVEKAGTVIAEVKLELRISSVENMFRHVDMTQIPKKYDKTAYTLPEPVWATRTGDPGESWPDSQTNGKYFVFIHGFNIDGMRARGWNSEVFKRLHVLGSKARFVGVSWHGATGLKIGQSYPDYYGAVFNAFQTGNALAGVLSFTGSADVTLAAHSLGNIVASQAIQNGGLVSARYYMINAASPIEAYDLPNVPDNQITRMTERKWKEGSPGNRPSYAANWHDFFETSATDRRKELKWKNRFTKIFDKTTVYDFYSPGDDVVEDPEWDSPSVLALILAQGFNFSRGAWVTQEFAKGASAGESLAVLSFSRVQGGWGQSAFFSPPWGDGSHPHSPDQTTDPYFGYFLEHDLFDPAKGSEKAGQPLVPYDLLARGIPALSFAVAVHPLVPLENQPHPELDRNFDMEVKGRGANGWPTEGHTSDGKSAGRWLHSDFKNVALPYVNTMYEEMIKQGSLK